MDRRLLLIALGGFLAVATIEGLARACPSWIPPEVFASLYPEWRRVFVLDPQMGYRLKPNQRVKIQPSIDHQPYWLVTDAQGFRNSRPYPKADIVAVGDSATEGVGLSDEITWVRQLERMLNRSVCNLGIRGTSLPHKMATLKTYGFPKRPSLVFLQYIDDLAFVDDETHRPISQLKPGFIQERVLAMEQERMTLRSPSVTYSLLRFSFKQLSTSLPGVRRLREAFRQREILRQSGSPFSIAGRQVFAASCSNADWLESVSRWSLPWLRRHPDWPALQRNLVELKEHCAERKIRLVLLLIPDPPMLYLPLVAGHLPPSSNLAAAVQNVDNHARLLTEFCSRHQIPWVDVTPALRAAAARGEQLCFPVDNHWNAEGHRVIARELFLELAEER